MDVTGAHDPAHLIAIVGMAGRFPGADSADALWTLLDNGTDAIGPVPADRWDTTAALDPERDIQAVGGFVADVDRFDARFFGISPREAAAIDPQQRLMLETAWRALEDAGTPAAALADTRTGVYVGASWHDYELLRADRRARPTPHSLVGNALDVIAARTSYFLKLRGPSLTVETGCSSSLVALHLAAQALRHGDIDAALVGGVNLILDPHVTIGLTHFGALSPTGRCQAFAATADGFVRGEGIAALYVKTLARAQADGDRVHGVVLRTVVNNDGGGESLVTPSPEGQRDLLRRAYADLDTTRYGTPAYIEAHGTGTGRGDPIEATAIGEVLGRHRAPHDPLHIGSVKTNIGHLEAAAGMAGLFKLLLALRHRTIPASLHAERPNPAIAFEELNLRVARHRVPLAPEGPLTVGVNSFGWGGTNAHVVLTTPPPPAPADPDSAPPSVPTGLPCLVPLSAHDPQDLAAHAAALTDHLPHDHDTVRAFAATLARRDHFPQRAAVIATTPDRLRTALADLAAGTTPAPETDTAPATVTGRAVPHHRTAFVFPGQGSQWTGMGQDLYRDSPLFAAVITRCAEALRPHIDWKLLDVFTGAAEDLWTTRIDMLQPTLWAMSLGLAELWRAHGIEPDVVLGHSQGEITAATFAGILSYQDAALIVARRSAIARRTSGHGRMLSVDLDRPSALAALEGFQDSVSLAVHNGPSTCVLSGETEPVLILKELLEAEGTYCRLVNVDYASHSPQMEPLRPDLLRALAPARPRPGDIDLFSTVRAQLLPGTEMDAHYWVENLRHPVQFADSMTHCLDASVTHVVEISPHPVLAPAVERLAAGREHPVAVLTTLRRGQGTTEHLTAALARAYTSGLRPLAGLPRARLPLPGYPLRRDRHWSEPRPRGTGATRGLDAPQSPAPGTPGTWHSAVEIALPDLPWLGDHQVHDTPVLPGTAMLTMALGAARARTGTWPTTVEQVVFHRAVALGTDPVRLTCEWRDDDPAQGGHRGGFRLLSLPDGATTWDVNATARAHHRPGDPPPHYPHWATGRQPAPADDFYRDWHRRGLRYGPAFQSLDQLHHHPDGDRALGRAVLPDQLRPTARPPLHPALWDGALQVCLALENHPPHDGPQPALIPTSLDRLTLHTDPDTTQGTVGAVWSHATRRGPALFDVEVFDTDRRPLLTMRGLRLEPLTGADDQPPGDTARLHTLRWHPLTGPARPTPAPGRWSVHGHGEPATALTLALGAAGATTTRATTTDTTAAAGADGVVFCAPTADQGPTAQRRALAHLAALATACADQPVPPRLAVVTTAAQAAATGDDSDPHAAQYWGFTRVLRREHPELAARLIDQDPDCDPALCAAEILSDDDTQDQVALRAGTRLAARLHPGAPTGTGPALPPATTTAGPFEIGLAPTTGTAACLPLTRRAPGPGEIEIQVTAAAVDRTCARALLEGRAPGATGCAGTVVRTGPGPNPFTTGDQVAACANGAPASHVTVRADHAAPLPAHLDHTSAAALPHAAATAHHALTHLARLRAGQTALIRISAAPQTWAALQIARALGAATIAVADTDTDRARLYDLGIETVIDGQDPAWPDHVRAATGGTGADLALNTLPGIAVTRCLRALADDGHLVHWTDDSGSLTLAELPEGAAVSTLRADTLPTRHPDHLARALAQVWPQVADGTVTAPPVRQRGFTDTADALAQAADHDQHATVVLVGAHSVRARTAVPLPGGRPRADGSYLITGGTGALGLSLARHLAEAGAGALLLLARRAPTPHAQAQITALRATGTTVHILTCDVADGPALNQALDQVRAQVPPLRGVVHAAGILADATIRNLTAEQITDVLAPKADGARNLDQATAGDPLDLFVLFSSAAALVGNAGQAAYAAANAYLDAFAHARRHRGLPALSVQWGPFADIGLAAADHTRGARLAERGMGSFPAEQAWPALTRMLARDLPVVGYVPINARQWFDAYPDTAALGSWQPLRAAADADSPTTTGAFLTGLLAAPPEERATLAETKIRELAAAVLRLETSRIERQTPFKALGLDSLMGLELRNRLEAAFGRKLSPTLLWAHGNPRALAQALCEDLPEPAPEG